MDMSNKSLALLLVAGIIISLGTTIVSVNELNKDRGGFETTGLVTDPGEVTISISGSTSCVVSQNVSFGSASIVSSETNISTDADNTASGFNDCSNTGGAGCRGLQIDNDGNADLEVNITSDVTGAGFLGGSHVPADFIFYMRNGTYDGSQAGCQDASLAPLTWTNVATTATQVCNNLTYVGAANSITAEFNVTIDENTPPTAKTATITVTCLAI